MQTESSSNSETPQKCTYCFKDGMARDVVFSFSRTSAGITSYELWINQEKKKEPESWLRTLHLLLRRKDWVKKSEIQKCALWERGAEGTVDQIVSKLRNLFGKTYIQSKAKFRNDDDSEGERRFNPDITVVVETDDDLHPAVPSELLKSLARELIPVQPVIHTISFVRTKDGRLRETRDDLSADEGEVPIDELTGWADAAALQFLERLCNKATVRIQRVKPAARFDVLTNLKQGHVFWIGSPHNVRHDLAGLLRSQVLWIRPLITRFRLVPKDLRETAGRTDNVRQAAGEETLGMEVSWIEEGEVQTRRLRTWRSKSDDPYPRQYFLIAKLRPKDRQHKGALFITAGTDTYATKYATELLYSAGWEDQLKELADRAGHNIDEGFEGLYGVDILPGVPSGENVKMLFPHNEESNRRNPHGSGTPLAASNSERKR
jgi:hypothetical protein